MATCFYCGENLRPKSEWWKTKRNADHDHTIDHIYPKAMVSSLTVAQKRQLPPNFDQLNTVDACRRCNNYKGHLHPIDWLVIMPYPIPAKLLAERMIKMGEDMGEVFDALRRRKK